MGYHSRLLGTSESCSHDEDIIVVLFNFATFPPTTVPSLPAMQMPCIKYAILGGP